MWRLHNASVCTAPAAVAVVNICTSLLNYITQPHVGVNEIAFVKPTSAVLIPQPARHASQSQVWTQKHVAAIHGYKLDEPIQPRHNARHPAWPASPMPLQHRNGEFIFRSSNAVKPATDLPEAMIKRVRAVEQNFCTMESRPGRTAPASAHTARRKARRAVREGSRCQDKHRSVSVPECVTCKCCVVYKCGGMAPQIQGVAVLLWSKDGLLTNGCCLCTLSSSNRHMDVCFCSGTGRPQAD